MTPGQREALEAYETHGSYRKAAEAIGKCKSTVVELCERGRAWQDADPSIQDAAKAGGIEDVSTLSHFWKIGKDEDGNGYSLFVKNPATGESATLTDMVKEAVDYARDYAPEYEKREPTRHKNLLKINLADVHVGKLCVKSETGFEYNQDVAVHRIEEGTKALLRKAEGHGIGHVLYVMGNDILHVDNAKGSTTSLTPQDTDGTVQTMFNAAKAGLIKSIEACAKVADVTLAFCPSNHDWIMGWALAQTIGAHFSKHPHVLVKDYYLSERHRKYFRFENNLIGLTHGDGAKEADLYPLMVTEAREHVSECDLMYWYLGHIHHKVRKIAGLNPNRLEKDLTGMTVMNSAGSRYRGDGAEIEYVRSPSPPDSWHDRNGYVNRQAVECYIHHPFSGQCARYTEWF